MRNAQRQQHSASQGEEITTKRQQSNSVDQSQTVRSLSASMSLSQSVKTPLVSRIVSLHKSTAEGVCSASNRPVSSLFLVPPLFRCQRQFPDDVRFDV